MYEVPERASDGKASGRCSGSLKGFRYIVLGIAEGGEIEAESFDFVPRQAKTNFYELNLKIKNE
jgi:hypothetical protein